MRNFPVNMYMLSKLDLCISTLSFTMLRKNIICVDLTLFYGASNFSWHPEYEDKIKTKLRFKMDNHSGNISISRFQQ